MAKKQEQKPRHENWLKDLYLGDKDILSHYSKLSHRELAIVSGALMDAALAQLITKRLIDHPERSQRLFELTDFYANIRLAYLLGILDNDDYELLNTILKIRNIFGHAVNVTFLSVNVQKELHKMHRLWMNRHEQGMDNDEKYYWEQVRLHLNVNPNVGAVLLTFVMTTEQVIFAKLIDSIQHLELITT